MFALLFMLVMLLLVGVGLLTNVYFYKYHALGAVHSSVTLDEQLFTYYIDVDTREV